MVGVKGISKILPGCLPVARKSFADELIALADTIKMLNSDETQALFRKTAAARFVQIDGNTALSFIQVNPLSPDEVIASLKGVAALECLNRVFRLRLVVFLEVFLVWGSVLGHFGGVLGGVWVYFREVLGVFWRHFLTFFERFLGGKHTEKIEEKTF